MENISNQVQIISEEGALVNGFQDQIKSWGLQNIKKDYNIVAIIGKQSSGKSTLLNNLFGTRFDVMNASAKRQQTTKGINVSPDQEKNLLVFDVEGSDSKERWEGHGPFEQSTALFSLVMAQLLMVNIWTQEVGRFTGSNYDILKVILESNLKLFKQEGKKTLVFILRDFTDEENPEEIKNTIKGDLYKIWTEIAKPKEYSSSIPETFFNIEFVFLTSYKFNKSTFTTQVKEFRSRFVDKDNESYFFKNFNQENNVPADGLSLYIQNVWTTIKDCKDINLPSQKTLVSNLRCTDIKAEALTVAEPKLKALIEKSKAHTIETYSIEGQSILNEALKSYSDQSEFYDKTVVEEKRVELKKEIIQKLYEGFELQVSFIKKTAVQNINSRLNEISINPDNCEGIMDKVNKVKKEIEDYVKNSILNAYLTESEWAAERNITEIKDQIGNIVRLYKDKQLAYIIKQKTTEIRREIEGTIINKFNNLSKDFWVEIDNTYNEAVRKVEDYIKLILTDSLQLDNENIKKLISDLNDTVYADLESDLSNKFQDLNNCMIKKFKNIFEKNENGIPINWKSVLPKEIENRYVSSKRTCQDILDSLKLFGIRKRGTDYLEKRPVVSNAQWENNLSKLNDDMEYEFKEAERKHNTSDISTIPKWFWIVLVYFMIDDVLRWVNNPLILYPVALIGGAIAVMLAIGMGNEVNSVLKGIISLFKVLLGPRLQKLGVNI